jgi:hypothetical protein
MEMMLLDKDFANVKPIDVYTSLQWTRRYYEPGMYELHMDSSLFPYVKESKYLYRNDRPELGLIQEYDYEQGEDGVVSMYCKGYFAESLLDERVIEKPVSIYETPEKIARSLVTQFFIDPEVLDRKNEDIVLGELVGLGTKVRVQRTGNPVGSDIYSIEKSQGMSHRLRYDIETDKLVFEVWMGKDRRYEQNVNSWAIFSNGFYNIRTSQYHRSTSDYKNYAYVAGEGEGEDRKIVEVDIRESQTELRKELYVDARDLQNQATLTPGGETHYKYTEEEYEQLLRQRGLEKLSAYKIDETMNANIEDGVNLTYMVDYDLGDICMFKDEDIGIEINDRITEIREVYEGVTEQISVQFGNNDVSSVKQLIEREAT